MAKNQQDGVRQRMANGTIQRHVPLKVRQRWKRSYSPDGKPRSVVAYWNMSDFEIVKTFSSQLRSLTNYYNLATSIVKGLRESTDGSVRKARERHSPQSINSIGRV